MAAARHGVAQPYNRALRIALERCEASLTGFILCDLWRIVSIATAQRFNLAKKQTFLAPQTTENLQQVALSTVTVCLSKPKYGDYWRHGANRVSELAIEEWFGRLRTQSANAQLSARAYWKAGMRDSLMQKRRHHDHYDLDELEPLTPAEFQGACKDALNAALELVASCSHFCKESLQEKYEACCRDGSLDINFDLLKPHPVEEDEAEAAPGEEDCAAFLQTMEATLGKDSAEPEASDFDLEAFLLRDLPHREDVKKLGEELGSETPGTSLPHLPHTLSAALTSERPLFDRVWRLCVFLRHGCLVLSLVAFHK